jgi:cytochrome o ubiquinol oxidase operon protein cyoD
MNRTHIDRSGASLGSLKSYGIGFILSVCLTAIAFAIVMSGAFSRSLILFGIFGAAIAQILVHLHFFLHLNRSSAARWNLLAMVFTVLIMILFVGGTLWIMFNLNARMM